MEISLKNINKSFFIEKKEFPILKNINLDIKSGEMAALVGPSGSGKTTLLQIAGLLSFQTSGILKIGDIDLSDKNDIIRTNFRKDNIGFIYQDHNLLPEFSISENIAMPLFINGEDRKLSLKKSEEILDKIGLLNWKDYFPHEISGGQKQRVSIARAVIRRPSILFADEPTGNLDSDNSNNILELFKNIAKDHNTTSLIVTHNIDLAKKMDRIIYIKDGKI